MNATRGELSKLQEAIAAGRDLMPLREAIAERQAKDEGREPKPPSDGEFYWHPNKSRLALRVYNSGRGIWLVKYRNRRGLEKTEPIGNATVLTLSFAENAAKRVLGHVALGQDPAGARQELRARPKISVQKLCEDFFAEKESDSAAEREIDPKTLYQYRNLAKNHLGALAQLQADEVTDRDIGLRTKEIDANGKHVALAQHFRAMLGTVFDWAMEGHLLKLTANPVRSAWRRKTKKQRGQTKAKAISIENLGAIWRGCEKLATIPPTFKGNVWGAGTTVAANSIRADNALLTLAEAERQSGISKPILDRAVKTGELKVIMRRQLPQAEHPLKIKRGYHRRTYLVAASELRRFAATRGPQIRSPHFEYSVVVRLLMLFGGRYMEMGGLRWSEIDLDKGTVKIPEIAPDGHRRTKTGDLTIFLPQAAIDLIKTVKPVSGRDCLFGGDRTTLTAAGKSTGLLQNHWLKKHLDQAIAEIDGAPIQKWKIHWLRHSFTTHLNEMGVDPRIIEAITNHKGAQVTAMMGRYNHAEYAATVRQVLKTWAQHLRNAADRVETDTSNVTQLSAFQGGK
jgi:integrase